MSNDNYDDKNDFLAASSEESSSVDDRDNSKKKKKTNKKDRNRRHEKKKRKNKKRRHASSSDTDESSSSSAEDGHRRRRKKKRKKKKHKKESKCRNDPLERNYQIAEALYSLLNGHPALSEDLPILLVRLASGSTLDFRNMTHPSASRGLNDVLDTLTPYGVVRDADGAWKWENPAGGSKVADERILVRVVRTLLNDIGLTIGSIDAFETESQAVAVEKNLDAKPAPLEQVDDSIAEALVLSLLRTFGKAELAAELVGLCDVILSGEAISLDGLPDEKLRIALEHFFDGIKLERIEMENEEEEEVNDENERVTTMGYCLSESKQQRALVESVQTICNEQSSKLVRGPLPKPSNYNPSDDEDDDGPLLPGQIRTAFASGSAPAEVDPAVTNVGGREEWMLVPGKHTFLSAIKSQPLKNRQFSGKSSGLMESDSVDPAIQQEIDALRKAHEESRGPSLMDEHQKQKAVAKAKKVGDPNWKWDRDRDLDSGRRVDKDALNSMLGGAGRDLKTKFQSSY